MLTNFIYFILPAILLILGIPIFLTLFVTSIVIVLKKGLPTESIQIYIFGSLDNYPLLAVPFFVLAFFQAEDGIRDTSVTGVQTCALPICRRLPDRRLPGRGIRRGGPDDR